MNDLAPILIIVAAVVGLWVGAGTFYAFFRDKLTHIHDLEQERNEARKQRNVWRNQAMEYYDLSKKQDAELHKKD
jgi:flagellar basal body-associated protein FliL